MSFHLYPPVSVQSTQSPTQFVLNGVDTEVSRDTSTPSNSTPLPVVQLDSSGNPVSPVSALGPIDFIDATVGPILDASANNIPGNASLPLEIVASLAADCGELEVSDDTGERMILYIGAASSEVFHTCLRLGGGNTKVNIPAGSRVSIGAGLASAITTGLISINFLGSI